MRPRGLALTALLLAAAPLAAAQPPQTPPPPPPPAQTADPLDDYLSHWQQSMEQINALSATLKRTEKDKVADVEKHYTGFTKYLRVASGGTAQNLVLLQMSREGEKDFAQRYVCSGSFLYEFVPSEKKIVAHEVPKPKSGQVSDDNFLSFVFGMKKEEAMKRYDLKFDHADANYIYVLIQPRFTADRVDFQRAQLVLYKDSFYPRRLWFEEPNGNEVTWDVTDTKINDKNIDRREFDAPTPPKDWQLVQAPKDAETPPRVVRPRDVFRPRAKKNESPPERLARRGV